jgi:hypothetical protein
MKEKGIKKKSQESRVKNQESRKRIKKKGKRSRQSNTQTTLLPLAN